MCPRYFGNNLGPHVRFGAPARGLTNPPLTVKVPREGAPKALQWITWTSSTLRVSSGKPVSTQRVLTRVASGVEGLLPTIKVPREGHPRRCWSPQAVPNSSIRAPDHPPRGGQSSSRISTYGKAIFGVTYHPLDHDASTRDQPRLPRPRER